MCLPFNCSQTLLMLWPKRVPEPAARTIDAVLTPDFMVVIVSCLSVQKLSTEVGSVEKISPREKLANYPSIHVDQTIWLNDHLNH
jgi:hypothetical protein